MHEEPRSRARTLALVLGGPALLGAALGMRFGLRPLLAEAALVVAIVVGVSVMMVPALYIGAAQFGVAPSAGRVVVAAVAALRASGTLLLGLAPASLFLLATSQSALLSWVLGFLVLGASQLVALRTLYALIAPENGRRLRALPVFVLWSVVALGLGAQLFARSLRHVETYGDASSGALATGELSCRA
jgi:hypothetical protein